MPRQAKTLFSLAPAILFPGLIMAWLIEIDGPTANNIAIAIVWAYFEVQRRNDMRKTIAIAEAKANPVAAATKLLEAKAAGSEARLDKIESATRPTISVTVENPSPSEER